MSRYRQMPYPSIAHPSAKAIHAAGSDARRVNGRAVRSPGSLVAPTEVTSKT
jgi:hypothetical protein